MKTAKQFFRHSQRGATAVEFALISGVFFMLLIGIMEMGRMLFYWNTATEATMLGARIAVVCNLDDDAIKERITSLFPTVSAADISLDYQPASCTATTCEQITVSILPGKSIPTFIPYVALSLTLPDFATTLTRESLQSSIDGVANPVCAAPMEPIQ